MKRLVAWMTQSRSLTRSGAFLLGASGLVLIMSLDCFYWQTPFCFREYPNFSPGHLFRSLLIILSIAAIGLGIMGKSRPAVTLSAEDGWSFERLSVLVNIVAACLILALFVRAPALFETSAFEDGPVEWSSFVLLFSGSAVVTWTAIRYRGKDNVPRLATCGLVVLAVTLFLVAMEEISWGQRVFGFRTPDALTANMQDEANLHNLATNEVEFAYYFFVFVFMAVVPFVRVTSGLSFWSRTFEILEPRPFIALMGCIACAYTYDMWNSLLMQVTFFGAVGILIVFAVFAANRLDRAVVLLTLVILLVSQVTFLVRGAFRPKKAEVNEYRELLMPLGLFLYAISMSRELERTARKRVEP